MAALRSRLRLVSRDRRRGQGPRLVLQALIFHARVRDRSYHPSTMARRATGQLDRAPDIAFFLELLAQF